MHHHEEEEKYVSTEEYSSVLKAYCRVVEESDGFDLENVSIPPYMSGGLRRFNCANHYPFRTLVKLYAMVGLHRYNMLEGTNFQLTSLVKFNMLQNCVSSYYMTLLAHDPAAGPLDKTFQVRNDEQRYGSLDFTCSIARLKEPKDEVTIKEPYIPHFHGGPPAYGIFKGELPDWPSYDDLKDETRFCVVKKSEWGNTDWIFMYLELVVVANDRFISFEDLSRLTFKGLAEPRDGRQTFEIGEHVERKAIVRRVLSESTRKMSLMGKLCGGNEEQCSSMTSQSGVKAWSSFFCRNGERPRSSKKRPRLG